MTDIYSKTDDDRAFRIAGPKLWNTLPLEQLNLGWKTR